MRCKNMDEERVYDYIDVEATPDHVLRRAQPDEVVAFSSNNMLTDELRYDVYESEQSMMYRGSDLPKNLQLYSLFYIHNESNVITRCYYTSKETGKICDVFETPCPEIAEIWQIIKKNNLYAIKLCQVLINLELYDPELESHIDMYNARFVPQLKSARNT